VWEIAVKEASKRSLTEIYKNDIANSNYIKVVALTPVQIQLITSSLPDKEHFVSDYELIRQAEAFRSDVKKR
jgi:hypothetical protein